MTSLLQAWRRGEPDAAQALLPQELRRLDDRALRSERQDHMLWATALIHEAFIRLADRAQRVTGVPVPAATDC
jgi:ECF sigma factor